MINPKKKLIIDQSISIKLCDNREMKTTREIKDPYPTPETSPNVIEESQEITKTIVQDSSFPSHTLVVENQEFISKKGGKSPMIFSLLSLSTPPAVSFPGVPVFSCNETYSLNPFIHLLISSNSNLDHSPSHISQPFSLCDSDESKMPQLREYIRSHTNRIYSLVFFNVCALPPLILHPMTICRSYIQSQLLSYLQLTNSSLFPLFFSPLSLASQDALLSLSRAVVHDLNIFQPFWRKIISFFPNPTLDFHWKSAESLCDEIHPIPGND
jgi:hypothetical protein